MLVIFLDPVLGGLESLAEQVQFVIHKIFMLCVRVPGKCV